MRERRFVGGAFSGKPNIWFVKFVLVQPIADGIRAPGVEHMVLKPLLAKLRPPLCCGLWLNLCVLLLKPFGPSEVTLAGIPGVLPRPCPNEVTEGGTPRICPKDGRAKARIATAHSRFMIFILRRKSLGERLRA